MTSEKTKQFREDVIVGQGEHIVQLEELNKKHREYIKQLEAQLAEQPPSIDWSTAPKSATAIGQDCDELLFLNSNGEWWDVSDDTWNNPRDFKFKVVATRPKPKYTPEKIQAASELYTAYLEYLSGSSHKALTFDIWLKEVNK